MDNRDVDVDLESIDDYSTKSITGLLSLLSLKVEHVKQPFKAKYTKSMHNMNTRDDDTLKGCCKNVENAIVVALKKDIKFSYFHHLLF